MNSVKNKQLCTHLRPVDRNPRLLVEKLGLETGGHPLVVLALGSHRQPVGGRVLHLEGPLQAVVIEQDVCQ